MQHCLKAVGFLALFVVAPHAASAVEPEQLLAADSLVYLRFDGIGAHQAAYRQTALGELMVGDLGDLFQYLHTILKSSLGPLLAKGQLLAGTPAGKQRLVREGFDRLGPALTQVWRQGVVLGVEIGEAPALRFQLTVVFPNAGQAGKRDALFAVFRLAAALAEVDIKERTVNGRKVSEIAVNGRPVQIAWWQEGEHVALIVGTAGPAHAMAGADGKRPTLLKSMLYQSLTGFKRFETAARGFVDIARAGNVVRSYYPPAESIRARIGLTNLKDLVFHLGFEGRSQRASVVLHVPGKRQGLLAALAPPREFRLEQLPPLPPDTISFYANRFDLVLLHETVVRMFAEGAEAENLFKTIDQTLGIDLRKDLLSNLEPLCVLYNSPAEGPFSLGFGLAVQVKDPGKLKEALTALFQSLPAALGVDISIKSRTYHGVEFHTLHYPVQGFFVVPTYVIHKDWLVVGLFPQTIQGYLMRSDGKYERWRPSPLTRLVLENAGKEGAQTRVLSVSAGDPRPILQQILSIAPVIAGLATSFAPNSFDVSKLPNSQAITEPLFPNVSVVLDDGAALRFESHASLSLPLPELLGANSPLLALYGAQFVGLAVGK